MVIKPFTPAGSTLSHGFHGQHAGRRGEHGRADSLDEPERDQPASTLGAKPQSGESPS